MSEQPTCPECASAVEADWDFCHVCGFDPDGLRPPDWERPPTAAPPGGAVSPPLVAAPPPSAFSDPAASSLLAAPSPSMFSDLEAVRSPSNPPPTAAEVDPPPPTAADAPLTFGDAARLSSPGEDGPAGGSARVPGASGPGSSGPGATRQAPAATAAARRAGTADGAPPSPTPGGPNRMWLVAGAVVLVLVVAVVVVAGSRRSSEPADVGTEASGTTKPTPPPLGALGIGAQSSSTALRPRAGWKPWEPPGNPFRVSVPGNVDYKASALSWGPGAKQLVAGSVETGPNTGYLIAYIDLLAGDPKDLQTVVSEFFTYFNRDGRADLGADADTTFAGVPAVKVVGSLHGTPAHGVALVRNARLYLLIAVGVPDDDYQYFLDSFAFE